MRQTRRKLKRLRRHPPAEKSLCCRPTRVNPPLNRGVPAFVLTHGEYDDSHLSTRRFLTHMLPNVELMIQKRQERDGDRSYVGDAVAVATARLRTCSPRSLG
ncbi:PREDICTED: uncharacterized protein LOC105561735 [Vollenhovia emeryi]|uniref:uncharacterized protein LOC105561735 n=1 Tax=Vollenhovia emeryi TaxID=411798 RepID=UPI0005F52B1B|nr:PREDICTED: uncharacterized protein LOC105561735 [Vollenhovia emeryi]